MQESDRWVVSPRPPRVDAAAPETPHVRPVWAWVGAHGGAGVSMLCRAAGTGTDCGRQWPASDHRGDRVLLVARTHGAGLAAVRQVLAARGADAVHGVVLVADAPGRLPRELRQQVRVLSGAAPRQWQVPWVQAWRTDPLLAPPSHIVRLLSDVTTPHDRRSS